MLFAAVCIEMARSDVGFLIQPSQRTNVAGKPNSYKVQWLLHCTPLLEESAAGDGGGCTAVLQELVPSELVMPPTETAKPITADEREQAGRLRAGAKVGARGDGYENSAQPLLRSALRLTSRALHSHDSCATS